jgi:hypothetical protein
MAFRYRWRRTVRYGLLASVLPWLFIIASGAGAARASATPPPTDAIIPTLDGRVVHFSLSGIEPDFDPIDRVIIAARLHNPHPSASALPDTTLVLSTYLENFQPKTMPVLPDLLRQDQLATSLGGFMQGKAALVDGLGRVRYRGSVLAEVFLDNTVHAIVDLDPRGLPAAAPVRLVGAFTLRQDLTLAGTLRPSRAFAPAEVAALRVTHSVPVSWQAIVGSLQVRFPKMMGTGGSRAASGAQGVPPQTEGAGGAPRHMRASSPSRRRAATVAPARPAPSPRGQQPRAPAPSPLGAIVMGLVALGVLALGAVLWRVWSGRPRRMGADTAA